MNVLLIENKQMRLEACDYLKLLMIDINRQAYQRIKEDKSLLVVFLFLHPYLSVQVYLFSVR